MDIEYALVAHLAADPVVGPLVVAGGKRRIYPLQPPSPATLPLITFQRISTPRVRDFGGDTGLVDPRIQITSWAGSYEEATALAVAVHAALKDLRNEVIGGAGGVFIRNVALDDERPRRETQAVIFQIEQDYIVKYKE
jgi:hypothetical protein